VFSGNACYNLIGEPEAIRECIERRAVVPVSDSAKAKIIVSRAGRTRCDDDGRLTLPGRRDPSRGRQPAEAGVTITGRRQRPTDQKKASEPIGGVPFGYAAFLVVFAVALRMQLASSHILHLHFSRWYAAGVADFWLSTLAASGYGYDRSGMSMAWPS
jgi:hypothetical protein